MTDTVQIALIMATPSLAAAILGFLNNVLGRRNAKHIAEAKAAIVTLEHNTNSIKDALVKVTGEAKFAEGLKLGSEGRTGPPGPQGEPGPQGDVGPKGKLFG